MNHSSHVFFLLLFIDAWKNNVNWSLKPNQEEKKYLNTLQRNHKWVICSSNILKNHKKDSENIYRNYTKTLTFALQDLIEDKWKSHDASVSSVPCTVTVRLQVRLFPAASVAVYWTRVSPTGNREPGLWLLDTVRRPPERDKHYKRHIQQNIFTILCKGPHQCYYMSLSFVSIGHRG